MRNLIKLILLTWIITGYCANMYYLTADTTIREHQWLNKVGTVLVPLGSVMGTVYIIDAHTKERK